MSSEPRTRTRRNGDGSIRCRSDGRYEVRWRDPDLKRRSRYAASEDEAREMLAGIVAARYQGVPEPTRRYRLKEWLPVWMATKTELRDRSRTRYEYLVRHWRAGRIGERRLPDISPEDVAIALGRMKGAGLSAATRASALAILRMALDQAVRSGYCGRNPARLIDAPRAESRPIAPPRGDELARLRAAIATDRLEALWTLCLDLGLRQGEALGLRWRDVNTRSDLLRVTGTLQYATHTVGEPKSRAGRRVLPMPADVVDVLKRHRTRTHGPDVLPHPDAWVFATQTGAPFHARNVLGWWYELCARAGVKRYRMHDLRHAAVTAMLTSHQPAYVSAWAGHSSLAMTDRYTHTELTDQVWEDEA